MLVWLVDFDGKHENLALMRLSSWHKERGDTVRLKRGAAYPELWETPDRVYISCLFRWHRRVALLLADAWGDRAQVQVGGTGVDIQKTLPPEVAAMPVDYDLYGEARAIGFISRGCTRKCPWCVVPLKEGDIHRVSTARELAAGRKELLVMDNNLLALSGHMDDLLWLAKNEIKVDFNQGLDARLIDEETTYLLAACKPLASGGVRVRLSLDYDGQKRAVGRAVGLLVEAGIRSTQIFVHCLIGYAGFESDIARLRYLRALNVRVFPMGYRDLNTGLEPRRGWSMQFYRNCKRLLIRLPFSANVWDMLEQGAS